MKKGISYLKIWDAIFAGLYLVFMTVVIIGYYFELIAQESLNTIVLFINIVTPMSLFMTYDIRLRSLSVFILWSILGIFHIVASQILAKTGSFEAAKGNYTDGMYGIVSALIAFLFAEGISRYIFKQEFVATLRGSHPIEGKRNYVDYILTCIGFGAIIYTLGFLHF